MLRDPWVALGSPGCSMLEHPEGESGCRGGDAEMPRGRGNARRLRRLVWRDAPHHCIAPRIMNKTWWSHLLASDAFTC